MGEWWGESKKITRWKNVRGAIVLSLAILWVTIYESSKEEKLSYLSGFYATEVYIHRRSVVIQKKNDRLTRRLSVTRLYY